MNFQNVSNRATWAWTLCNIIWLLLVANGTIICKVCVFRWLKQICNIKFWNTHGFVISTQMHQLYRILGDIFTNISPLSPSSHDPHHCRQDLDTSSQTLRSSMVHSVIGTFDNNSNNDNMLDLNLFANHLLQQEQHWQYVGFEPVCKPHQTQEHIWCCRRSRTPPSRPGCKLPWTRPRKPP